MLSTGPYEPLEAALVYPSHLQKAKGNEQNHSSCSLHTRMEGPGDFDSGVRGAELSQESSEAASPAAMIKL